MSSVPQSAGMGNTSGQDSWSIPGAGSALGMANSALGAYRGVQSGTPLGYANATVDTGKLAGKLGLLGDKGSALNQGVGGAANALGIYSGIKQGGVSGYGGAAVNAAQLGSGLGLFGDASAGIGAVAGYAAIPLALFNEINSWQSGNTGADALSGAETGAAIGSVIPGIGTVIGGLVGGAAGALSSAFGPGKKAVETSDYGALTGAYNQAGQQGGREGQKDLASEVQNPYELMAGMFDLRNGQIDKGNTLYNEYGRMGEQKFTNDLAGQLNQAKASGKITPDMDASQIYSSVIDPWEQSWGKGANTDPNSQLIKDMTTQMISQYEGGQAANNWRSVGGDQTFKDIYQGAPQTWGSSAKNQPAPTASSGAKPVALDRLGVPMVGYKDGGHARRKSALEDLRKKHFDDGGDVSLDNSDYSGPSFTPATDYGSIYEGGSGNDTTDFQNQNFGDLQQQFTNDQAINQQLGTWLDNYESAHSGSGSSGSKSGSGGIGGLGKAAAPYAALLPIISGLLNKSGSGSAKNGSFPNGITSGPTGPFQAQVSPRTSNPVDPNTDWYTYGQHPEKEFFSNNSIGPLMGKFAQQPSSALGTAPSTPPTSSPGNMQPMPTRPGDAPAPVLRSHGGALDSLGDGTPVSQGSRYVRGPGDGQSDDIDAKLSDGEYVMDAHTVSMLGNGSNEAGAKRLDQLRENLRKAAAKPMAKGKQFMKAKPPEAYLKGGKKKPLAFDVEGEG